MATAWAVVCMGTCLPPVMRTSQQELQEVLLCREGFLCPSLIQHQRWTWPQRLPSPLSHSTPPLSQPPTYQRPTMSHAKRSMPKKHGRARNPPLHYSSNQFLKSADSQVASRYIRDCDMAEVESLTSQSSFFLFVVLLIIITKRTIPFPCGLSQNIIFIAKSAVDKLARTWQKTINVNLQDLAVSI